MEYDYFNKSTSMQGISTTVSVSSAYLKKCMNVPEKAKVLENTLKAIPECVSRAISGCQGTLTNLSYKIDNNGNLTIAISGTSDPDGKIAKENAERKAKEQKEREEKLEKKRAEKKEQEERLAEQRTERQAESEALQTHEVTFAGSDI